MKCADNKPTECTECQAGSYLNGTVCTLNTTCNADESCEYCGQGLGYYLTTTGSGEICEPCPEINKCIQCDDVNPYECVRCEKGYYSDYDGVCQNCSSNCTSCRSD